MPFVLEPLVGGVLGERTQLEVSTHPPTVLRLEYTLDAPMDDDLLEAFPVFLLTRSIAREALDLGLSGIVLEEVEISKSDGYLQLWPTTAHKDYVRLVPSTDDGLDCWLSEKFMLCVSDRLMELLRRANLDNCEITETEA